MIFYGGWNKKNQFYKLPQILKNKNYFTEHKDQILRKTKLGVAMKYCKDIFKNQNKKEKEKKPNPTKMLVIKPRELPRKVDYQKKSVFDFCESS